MRVELLYPELAILYGERANAEYLVKSAAQGPDGAELVETHLDEEPAFVRGEAQIVYLGSMEEEFFGAALEALRRYQDELLHFTENGGVFLATGNAIDLFGKTIEWEGFESGEMEGLGIFSFKSVVHRDFSRHNSWFTGRFEDITVMATRSTFSRQYGGEEAPFIETTGGFGMNDETKQEGCRKKGLYVTSLLGPLCIMCPPMARYFLKEAGYEGPPFEEEVAMRAYHNRLKNFTKEGARFGMAARG